uniref:Uncharacterized protein n=1 Tax=Arundo donax TaxID=35708 RepID=A0A0A9FCI5_ARUDO
MWQDGSVPFCKAAAKFLLDLFAQLLPIPMMISVVIL